MKRCFPLVFLFVLQAAVAELPAAQSGISDPVFEKIPFDLWLLERDHSHFRWDVKVWPTVLTYQQRLRTRVSVQVDGREVLERRGKGQILLLVQFKDSGGRTYQCHSSIDLQNIDERMKSVNMIWDLHAFVLPGEYEISFAICHTATGEHRVTQRTLQVRPLRGDPLVDVWRGLPMVEFLEAKDPPDSWYLPSLCGCLNLPIETQRPVQIDVILNASPSEQEQTSPGLTSNRNLGVLIPLLKVITQVKLHNGTLNAALLDLMRQRASFEQRSIRELDWERLKAALTAGNPNTVDAQVLASRQQMAQFFVREVARRVTRTGPPKASPEPLQVLIVLSGPMAFAKGEDLHPIEVNAGPNLRVYYFRCQAMAGRPMIVSPIGRGGPRRPATGRSIPRSLTLPDQMDYLEGTIKPLKPRVFEVRTPEDFRKALSTMLEEIKLRGEMTAEVQPLMGLRKTQP